MCQTLGPQGPWAPGAREWVQGSLRPWGLGAPGAQGPWGPRVWHMAYPLLSRDIIG